MHTLEIPDKKIKLEYASCLEELTPSEARYFVFLYMHYLNKEVTGVQLRKLLAIKLLKIKSSVRFYMLNNCLEKENSYISKKDIQWNDAVNSNLLEIAESLKSFFSTTEVDGDTVEHLDYQCIKNIIPKIGGYYGPQDGLTDLSFWEYKEAHSCFVQYVKTNDTQHLARLAAILYRPKKKFLCIRKRLTRFDGFIRAKFNPQSNPMILEKRSKKMKLLNCELLYYVFLFFKSCEEYLLTGKPVIDGKEINLSVLYEGGSGGDDGIGLTGVLFTLAETRVFGDIDKTSNAGLYDVLARLYQVTMQYKNIGRKTD